MNIHRWYHFKKAIIVTEASLRKLDKMLREHYKGIGYHAYVKDYTNVHFETLDELVEFDNYKRNKLEEIKIVAGNSDYANDLEIEIGNIDWAFPGLFYISTIRCRYDTKDSGFDVVISKKLDDCFNSMTAWYWLLNKFHFLISVPILVLVGWYTYKALGGTYVLPEKIDTVGKSLGFIGFLGLLVLAVFGLQWMFPIKLFNLGLETKRIKRMESTRKFVFVAVILTIILGVIVNKIS